MRTQVALAYTSRADAVPSFAVSDTTNILFIVSGAFVGLDRIIRQRMQKTSIGFTARVKSDLDEAVEITGSTTSSEDDRAAMKAQQESALLDQVEPGDLVRYGFIPE